MARVAVLTSGSLMTGAAERHRLADMYDLQRDSIANAAAPLGIAVREANWRDPDVDWSHYDAALALAAWDYQDHHAAFLDHVASLEAGGVQVFNPRRIIEWNIRKTYLRDLADKGVPTIPTLWPEAPSSTDVASAFAFFGVDKLVLKRQVGAGAHGQRIFTRGEPVEEGAVLDRPGMLQPLMTAILDEGEYSFLFVDGALSHALVKRPVKGEYRIQETYGGVAEAITPAPADLRAAESVLASIDEKLLYARVDMVRGSDGNLLLMELELIEPFLYPAQGPDCGEAIARALKRRLG